MHVFNHVLTIFISVTPTPANSATGSASSSDNTLQIIGVVLAGLGVIFTGVYVVATLVIVRATNRSVTLTGNSLDLARLQITENKKQSEATLEASTKQSQESIYNQHKPVIVTVEAVEADNKISTRLGHVPLIPLKNVGLGIAMNLWGTIGFKGAKHYSSVNALFLPPNNREVMAFDYQQSVGYPFSTFQTYADGKLISYDLYPPDENYVHYDQRLMLTYKDVFDNKYLVIYDHSIEFGWRFVTLRKVVKTMDEIAGERQLP